MLKNARWTSLAEADLADLLCYLSNYWNNKVALEFVENLDNCILRIKKNPKLFAFYDANLHIRKCVITKHNTLYYIEKETKIMILRLYDSRQNPNNLKFEI